MLALGTAGHKPSSDQYHRSLHRQTAAEAEGSFGAGVVSLSIPATLGGRVQSSGDHAKSVTAAEYRGAEFAGEHAAGGSAEKSLEATTSTATGSTTNTSTAERDELARFHQNHCVGDAAIVSAGGPKLEKVLGGGPGGSSVAERKGSSGDIGLGQAVLAAARELAHHCQIPGVSEAAGAVCMMANLVVDGRESDRASISRLRQCRSIVVALKRAAKVADKVSRQSDKTV